MSPLSVAKRWGGGWGRGKTGVECKLPNASAAGANLTSLLDSLEPRAKPIWEAENIQAWNTNDLNSLCLQALVSFEVISRLRFMLLAIDLDSQAGFWTIEVDHVGTNGDLPPKLEPQLLSTKMRPKNLLSLTDILERSWRKRWRASGLRFLPPLSIWGNDT